MQLAKESAVFAALALPLSKYMVTGVAVLPFILLTTGIDPSKAFVPSPSPNNAKQTLFIACGEPINSKVISYILSCLCAFTISVDCVAPPAPALNGATANVWLATSEKL